MLTSGRQVCAGGKSHQVARVRHVTGFIEIVDAPNEPAFDVAPGTEIFYVQIADGEQFGCIRSLGRSCRPGLRPTIESRAEEWKLGFRHQQVLAIKIRLD